VRWLAFIVCAIVVLTLQATVAERMEWRGVRPDWVLVLITFFALNARNTDALLGAWALGAACDLMSVERFGLLSLSYGLVALLVYAIREYVFGEHPLTHVCVTLVACVLMQTMLAGYRAAAYGPPSPSFANLMVEGVWTGLYTAVWAPVIHGGLLRFSRVLGVRTPRYRHPRIRRTAGTVGSRR
jgi:rod shape-determining protein MreD